MPKILPNNIATVAYYKRSLYQGQQLEIYLRSRGWESDYVIVSWDSYGIYIRKESLIEPYNVKPGEKRMKIRRPNDTSFGVRIVTAPDKLPVGYFKLDPDDCDEDNIVFYFEDKIEL